MNPSAPVFTAKRKEFHHDQDVHSGCLCGGRNHSRHRRPGRRPAIQFKLAHGGFHLWQGRDTDTIRVPGTARYHQMRVCVSGGPIQMRDVDVRFRNGGHQDIGTRQLMRAGTCTRNVDLRGNRRDVTAVRLSYAPLARGWIRPTVRVQVR